MEELFGVPTQQLLWILLAVFGAGALILGLSALRNRVSFRMAARNLPRRRTQTILVVLGLMLATMLFSASFTTGDTLTNSLRLQSLENLGQVDVQVQADGAGASGQQQFGDTSSERAGYFDAKVADEVRDRLSDENHVSGVAPAAIETVPVTAKGSDLSEPSTDVLGLDESPWRASTGSPPPRARSSIPADLGKDEIYLSADAAKGLDVETGDVIEATFAQKLGTTAAPNAPPAAARPWCFARSAAFGADGGWRLREWGESGLFDLDGHASAEAAGEGGGRRAGSTPSSSPTKGRPSRAPRALAPPRTPSDRSSRRTTFRPSLSRRRP